MKRPPGADGRGETAPAALGWVFGYASLVADAEPRRIGGRLIEPRRALLRGFERRWCVAADNRAAVNDPRHYVDPVNGERPDVSVAFLSIVPIPGGCCEGLAIPVDADALRSLDEREINYRRVEVTAELDPSFADRVWTYIGLEEAAERFHRAREAGRLLRLQRLPRSGPKTRSHRSARNGAAPTTAPPDHRAVRSSSWSSSRPDPASPRCGSPALGTPRRGPVYVFRRLRRICRTILGSVAPISAGAR